jgi:ribonuclease Z
MRIRLLGTGTPAPSLRRMSSGYLVEVGNDVIILDHGFGAHHRLLELGVPATRVTHLFFTHLHYDHCGDYARLMLTRWDHGAGQVPDLQVFGPPPLASMTEKLFSREGVFGPDLVSRTEHDCSLSIYQARGGVLPRSWPQPHVQEISVGDVVHTNSWRIKAGSAHHFHPYIATLAFRVEADGCSVVYSGDSGPIASMRTLAEGADVLIHMCQYRSGSPVSAGFADSCMGHMELAHLAADAKVHTLIATHIAEQFDIPEVRAQVVAEMSSIYRGNLMFGEDLMEIPIGQPS